MPTSQTPATALTDQVRRVDVARRSLAATAAALAERRAEFEREHAALLREHKERQLQVQEQELRLRDMAVLEFSQTGDRKPAPGVSIRMATEIRYDDEAAFAWAKQSGMCLTLDAKAFDAIARHNPLPFVTREDVPTATIARDLSAAVGADEPEEVTA